MHMFFSCLALAKKKFSEIIYKRKINDMAKAKKEGKPSKNRRNLNKKSKILAKNREIIAKIESSLK